MKHIQTFLTILALVVLAAVGYHLLQKNQKNTHHNEVTFVEIIEEENGETQEIELTYPLTESFSNQASNEKVAQEKKKQQSQKTYTQKTYTQESLPKRPFILGTVYSETIEKYGIENCSKTSLEGGDTEDRLNYEEDNLEITSISISGRVAYLFSKATKIPQKRCAEMTVFNTIYGELFDAIFVVIE